MIKELPTGKLSRGKVIGKAVLRIGAAQTKGYLKRKLGAKKTHEQTQNQTHEATAQIIIDALGHLKGVSVKIAQQIALGMPFLPPEYLEKISQSFSAIPPINKALIRKIIKQELGKNPGELFDRFDNEPFGAASLGQVHLAEDNGHKLAVKVQYSGIAKSIASDMSLLKFALTRFAKGQDITHLTDEINGRLEEEVDYEIEAEHTMFFRKHLGSDLIIIPEIIDELSTSRVITSTFLDGLSFEAFLGNNPSQEIRDAYAQQIFELFFTSLYRLKQIHADPNPGNFLFMENSKLGMIDFGCVKKINDDFLHAFNQLHLSLISREDEMDIVQQYVNLNMIDEANDETMLEFYQTVIKPLDQLYIEIFHEDTYDFRENSDFSKRGFDTILKVQKKQLHSVHKLNEEYIFLDRTLLGYYSMFEKMGAKINTRSVKNIMKEYT